jgi:TonB-linked SusC/RagA family outer membrane protein
MQHTRLLNRRFCNETLRRSLPFFLAGALALAQLPAGAQELVALQKDPPQTPAAQADAYRPLQEVLKGMESRFGIYFMFDSDQLKDRLVSPSGKPTGKVEEQLRALLEPAGLRYKKVGSIYVITAGPNPGVIREIRRETSRMGREPNEAARLAALSALQAGVLARHQGARELTVSGRVTDDNNEGLPGVNVLVKGTSTGTTTNGEGNYSLVVPDGNGTLVFSYIGYVTEEVPISNRTSLDVSLVADIKALSEVVVVGYGTQKRSDLTGSVSSVKAEEVKNLPVRSVAEALQGRAAGVQITRNDGAPGAASDIVIRGAGSVGGMAPLYIVDGIRMSPGNNFNLQDVESIEILKDASAAAIYGAQAAGGVVLVTTKRGASGDKVDINFNAYYGFRQPRNLYSLLNTNEYFQARQAFGTTTGGWGDPGQLPDTDWVDELFGTGKEQSYSLSLSGASGKSNYYLSANYQREDGVRVDNWFERYGLRANSDYKITKRLKVGETLFAWRTGANPAQSGQIPFRSVPTMTVRDPNNPFGGWGRQPDGGYFGGGNPVADEYIHHRQDETFALEGNVYADWEILDGLNFRSTFGASVFSEKNSNFREAFDFGSLKNTNAQLIRDNNNQQNLTANFVLTYAKTFGQHDFKVMAGYEAYKENRSTLRGEAQGFQVITQNLGLTTDPTTLKTSGGQNPQTRLLSQFGRINYTFAGKYLLTANIRRDGSDRFGPANQWGVFPSVSVGWKVSEEAFMRALPFVSTLKLRASYGRLGSTSNIPQFTYQGSYGGAGGTNIHGLPDGTRTKGYALTAQLPNPDIKWEEVDQADIGLDVGVWNNRLSLTADWYSRQTNDMIYQVPVPSSAGYDNSTVYTNIGQMSNRGVELAAEYRDRAGAFTYSIGANASFNRNEVKRLDGTNNNPINDGYAGEYLEGAIARTEAGRPLSQFFGYQVEGIFGSDAEVAALNQQAQARTDDEEVYYQNENTGAGDLRFRDVNGDGRITVDDRTFIGNPWPKVTYGVTLNLGWKGFDLAALLQGVGGVDLYNGNQHFTQYFAGDYNTTADIFGTSFFNGNGLTDRPRVGFTDEEGNFVRDPNGNYTRISSYYVESGAYFRLRNLQLGYTLPKSLTGRAKLSNVRLYLQGQNLLTFTPYSGMDPEVLGNGRRNDVNTSGTTGRGIDTIGAYPRTRFYSLGIDVSF